MPPKSASKKLNKKDKDKLKQEELERKQKEEEEAKAREDEEAANRKEQDKLEAEERRQLENEERKKRRGQLQELDSLWESHRNTLMAERSERRKQDKWDRYMRCDGSPDPTIQGEINTYMNLWKEDLEHIDIKRTLNDSELALSLVEELTYIMENTPIEELGTEVKNHENTLLGLKALLQERLDMASHDLLLRATEMQNTETLNQQEVVGNEQITLCVWGNLSKNPRIKSHEFVDVGFTFEIPKVLTLSDCTVRVLFTKYDHYSNLSRSFLPRVKKPIEEEVPEPEPEAPKEGEGEEGEKPEGEEGEEKDEEEAGISREETQEGKKDVMAALNALNEDEEEKVEEEEEKAEELPMEEDVEIKTPEPTDYEDFDGDEDAVDLRAYQVMGGVFHLNLLHMPPQPKPANNWTIRRVEPPQLDHMEYIADTATVANKPADQKNGEEQKKDDKPAIGVSMSKLSLPSDVYFSEEPLVARWDHSLKQWNLTDFTDHKFDEEKRILTFKTSYFGTMALLQDAHINMPFQSWELRPRATNHALLTIIAAIVEVEIEIKDGQCRLLQPAEKAELEHLRGQWLPTKLFIKAMKLAGLNLFPSCDSTKYVSIQNKSGVTEERLYQQLALVASSMAFSWSKWNAEVESTDKIVIQGTEHLQDEPLIEEDWGIFLITKKRTTKLRMSEFDEAFSDDHAEGTEFNADLYHMAMELASEDGKERLRETNHLFVDSVYSLLKGTRLLTYS